MIDLNVLFQELSKISNDSFSIEIKTLEENEAVRISIGNSEDVSLKEIISCSFKGICFDDSINEEVFIYKTEEGLEAAKCKFISENLIEYWIEKTLHSPDQFYDYLFEQCIESENYHINEWRLKLSLPDLLDIYGEKVEKLKSEGWILAYQYLDAGLINGELHREIYFRETSENTVEVMDIYPPQGDVSDTFRKFHRDHSRWDIDSTYSWKDFYDIYKEGKGLDQIFEIEIKTKSELKDELQELDETYGNEILIDVDKISNDSL